MPIGKGNGERVMQRFQLEAVLNQRKITEEKIQKEAALINRALAGGKVKLMECRKAKDIWAEELRERQKEGITASESVLYLGFSRILSKNIEKQRERVAELERKMEAKRQDLNEAVKNRKALEKLKEKKEKAYLEEVYKAEQKLVNEISTSRFGRTVTQMLGKNL